MTNGDKYMTMNCNLYEESLPEEQAEQNKFIEKFTELGDDLTMNDLSIDEDAE